MELKNTLRHLFVLILALTSFSGCDSIRNFAVERLQSAVPMPTFEPEEEETSQEKTSHPIPVIWDDDGSPDGVIALLYLLAHPGYEVTAATISSGEAHPGIFAEKLAALFLELGVEHIPVGPGSDTPLEGNNAFPDPWRVATDEFWWIELPKITTNGFTMADDLIIDVVNQAFDRGLIFVSGTHTNLALALRKEPRIGRKIDAVHIMGGALRVPGNIASDWPDNPNKVSEWNIWVDPIAAHEVFASGLVLSLTPLDATNHVVWTRSDADTWRASGTREGEIAADVLDWMLDSWFPEGVYAWDLVTAVNMTNPELCEHENLAIDILTVQGEIEGQSVIVDGAEPNASVCIFPDSGQMKSMVAAAFSK